MCKSGTAPNDKVENRRTEKQKNSVYDESIDYTKLPILPPRSCGCDALMTWHGGRIEHKRVCPIFRKLNPNLTVKEFMKYEGFPVKDAKDVPWPSLDSSILNESIGDNNW